MNTGIERIAAVTRHLRIGGMVLCLAASAMAADFSARFEEIKRTASPAELYAFLFALPKGADLHHHNSLDAYASVWYAAATSQKTLQRHAFYTLIKFGNCPGSTDSLPRFYNIQRATYESLDACQKAQYQPLAELSPELKAAWISSLMLDKPGEGRDEFFERIVARFGDLTHDPYLASDVMVENMRLFGAEKVRYIETQILTEGFRDATGKPMGMDLVNEILCERLRQPDALATGVQIRFIDVIIRFLPDAEHKLELAYAWVSSHRDQWVGINMAGREDNDKGFPLRFLETYRKMRSTYSDIPLSIHGGEKDNPGRDVRETMLLGATRIGHGLNLISDPDTMLLMRHGQVLVEINLVSNHVLQYFPDMTKHPFPEYLRFGVPVCLNTDDRGSWDSNMTDEYYTGVKTFNLSWKELVELGRNSLTYSFADPGLKSKMLDEYDRDVKAFEARFNSDGWRDTLKAVKPLVSGYAHRSWGLNE